ncbi:hypothetical protein LSAT2_025878, partial [Lamellibrachia satsuma]
MPPRRIQGAQERIERNSNSALFLTRFKRTVDDCLRLVTTDHLPASTRAACITRLEALERHTRRANGTLLQKNAAQQLLELLRPIIEEFKKGNGEDQVRRGYHYERTEAPRST